MLCKMYIHHDFADITYCKFENIFKHYIRYNDRIHGHVKMYDLLAT